MKHACLALVFTSTLLATGCQPGRRVQADSPPAPSAVVSPSAPAAAPGAAGTVRATGTIQAARAQAVQVPQIVGQNTRITLVKLTPNGSRVNPGDFLAEFDRTQQVEAAREAQAKFEDLSHQVRQKEAQNRSEAAKRASVLKEAEAELARAEIQLRKGPILSEIDRLKNEARAEAARARRDSLKKSGRFHDVAEAAALRGLQLQMQRQQFALERARKNAERLVIRSPIGGMVALETLWRMGSMGNAQEGDQLWPGQTLMRVFDPTEMEVHTRLGEPEGELLRPGTTATVYLDAYPDAVFQARLVSASPVATAAIGSPIKNFTARFRVDTVDPRLLPDLSAAVVIQRTPPAAGNNTTDTSRAAIAQPGGLAEK